MHEYLATEGHRLFFIGNEAPPSKMFGMRISNIIKIIFEVRRH
jgi:hypothetical protein